MRSKSTYCEPTITKVRNAELVVVSEVLDANLGTVNYRK